MAKRKLVVGVVVAMVLAAANAGTIVGRLRDLGVLPLVERIRSDYLTGTAIAVIVALLILLPGRAVWAICVRRCPVCDAVVLRSGKYCGDCGARV